MYVSYLLIQVPPLSTALHLFATYPIHVCYHVTCLSNTLHFTDIHLHGRSDDVNEARYQYGRRAYSVDNEAEHAHPQGAAKIHDMIHNFDCMFPCVLLNLFVVHCMMV